MQVINTILAISEYLIIISCMLCVIAVLAGFLIWKDVSARDGKVADTIERITILSVKICVQACCTCAVIGFIGVLIFIGFKLLQIFQI